mgnify:CR=1 FL=1
MKGGLPLLVALALAFVAAVEWRAARAPGDADRPGPVGAPATE